jgi:predicted membrane metal-binding protein
VWLVSINVSIIVIHKHVVGLDGLPAPCVYMQYMQYMEYMVYMVYNCVYYCMCIYIVSIIVIHT